MRILPALALCASLLLAACGTTPDAQTQLSQKDLIVDLNSGIAQLGPMVDPEEAARAARIAYEYTAVLKAQYKIVDPPLVHNTKVNMGIKPRGLCKDWADDLEARLREEGFKTLSLHRAIANSDTAFLIEHSTVIVSQIGDGMNQGIVLDPWRHGGTLHWSPTLEDPKYKWIARQEVFETKRRRAARGV